MSQKKKKPKRYRILGFQVFAMAAEITTAYADGELDEGLFGVELVGNNDESQRTVLDGYALEHGREHEQEHENENYYNNQENDDTTHEQLGQTLTTTTTAEEFDPEPVMSSMASSSACSSGTVINGSGSVCDQDTNSRTTTESETPIMKKPLRLLDLPLDVLRDIVKEVNWNPPPPPLPPPLSLSLSLFQWVNNSRC